MNGNKKRKPPSYVIYNEVRESIYIDSMVNNTIENHIHNHNIFAGDGFLLSRKREYERSMIMFWSILAQKINEYYFFDK